MISPEGCASILWKSAEKASLAAEAMSITSNRLKDLGLIDDIIPEPLGGAHRDVDAMAKILRRALWENLSQLEQVPIANLLEARYQRLMNYGQFNGE